MPAILSLYIARRFLKSLFIVYLVILSSFFTIDFIEMLKRASARNINIFSVFSHTALKIPFILQETFIFATFIAAIYLFIQLSKKNEYVVLKASGMSIWQFLSPALITVGALSIFMLTILNPISSHMLVKQEKLNQRLLSDNAKTPAALFESGFWLVDTDKTSNTKLIIHSDSIRISPENTKLQKVSIMFIDSNFRLNKTLDANYALLEDKHWVLHNATEHIPKQASLKHTTYQIPTTITKASLQNHFKKPKRISIWELPYFIKTLKSTGYSAKAHILYFYKLLLKPFIALTLICIAAAFTLHPFRGMKLARAILSCGLIGFALYTLAELVYIIGTDSGLSPFLTSIIFIIVLSAISISSIKYSKI